MAYLIYKDVNGLVNESKLILLESKEKIQTGYILSKDTQRLIASQDLMEINNYYKNKNLNAVRNSTYRLIILDTKLFKDLPDIIPFENITYNKQSLLLAIDSETPEDFSLKLGNNKGDLIGDNNISNEDLIKYKATIAGILLSSLSEDPKNLIKGIKNKEISFYPNSITIILLNQLPSDLLESQISKKLSEIKEED